MIPQMTASDYIALCALIVSVCAFSLTIYQGYLNREHQKISVKPKLDIDIHSYKNNGQLTFDVTNKGLGPAFVTKFSVYVDGKKINSNTFDLWRDVVNALNIKDWVYEMYVPTSNSILIQGVSNILWKLSTKPDEVNIEELIHRIKIVINYKSIYGEEDVAFIDGRIKHEPV